MKLLDIFINYLFQSRGDEVVGEMDFTARSDDTGLCSSVLSCG
jgi:hypothetical protein